MVNLPDDPAIVTEDELRRYIRAASCLLAVAAPPVPERLALLRRARSWLDAARLGIDQLVREAEAMANLDDG